MSGKGSVYLFMGDDEFAAGIAAQQFIHKLVPESERAFGLEIIDGRADNEEGVSVAIKRCLEAFMTRGFFSEQGKVVWWRDVNFLADGQVAQNEEVKSKVKELAQFLKDTPPGGNVLLVTAPKVDKRSSFYKTCASLFEVKEFSLPEKTKEVENYGRAALRQALSDHKLRASPAAIELFISKVGADSRQIFNEVEKLALYTHGQSGVSEYDIDAIVVSSSESALWDIQDAVGKRQLSRALQILHRLLAQKESAIAIVTVIVNRVRELLVYREALDRGWLRLKPGYGGGGMLGEWNNLTPDVEEVLTVALKKNPRALHEFRVGILGQQAQAYSLNALKNNQRLAMAAHESLVSSSVPEETILEVMLAKMMA